MCFPLKFLLGHKLAMNLADPPQPALEFPLHDVFLPQPWVSFPLLKYITSVARGQDYRINFCELRLSWFEQYLAKFIETLKKWKAFFDI